MAKLGSAQTKKFAIGTAELRLGLLSEAMLLDQSKSVGLIDDATWTVNQTSVDLLGLFPRTPVDTAITEQAATITATMRDYSRRNLKIMLGAGLEGSAPVDAISALDATADLAAGATVVNVTTGEGTKFAADDVIIVYPVGRPEDVSVLQIASISVDALTLKTGQATLVDYNALTESGTTFKVYVSHQVAIGDVVRTNYFSAMLIQQENTSGDPTVINFWKCATSGTMEVATNAEDFASSTMELKVLVPAISEYGAGGDLEHVADLVPTHPSGFMANGA